ncbi:MAG: alkaline phosphatase D family protein, partial [Planctomycetes bacterium]|nr:alkaline phosphatase D family protein [Planctomycetota bacterium]
MFENKNKSLLLCSVMLIALLSATADAVEIENHITHGPILGRLSSSTVGVWVRTAEPGQFQVHYGTDSANLDQRSAVVETKLANDCTGWVLLQDLDSHTQYYYRVQIPEVVTLSGRRGSFRTLPAAKQYHHKELNPKGLFNFKFEYACGNNQNPGHSNGPTLPTFHTMLREIKGDIDFAILNGDWLYETQREYTPSQWLHQVGQHSSATPSLVKTAPSIVGVWQNYKHFLNQAPVLTEWHRQVPSFFTYDDHEILNDVWGAGSPGLRDGKPGDEDPES